MNGELSHGLAGLATRGNRIVQAGTGAEIRLRGVNRSGLEYVWPDEQGFLSGASISRAEIGCIIQGVSEQQQWRCNVVRIPLNQDFVFHGRAGHSGDEYQRALDQVISWNAAFGAYTLLDLQWLDAERLYGHTRDGKDNYVAPLPNSESIELWKVLGSRYKEEPAVLYDLFNEPHDRLPDDPYPLNRADGGAYPDSQRAVTVAEWTPWAKQLTAALRGEHPGALVFIGGLNWAYDLRAMPMEIDNAVYSTHVYPDKGGNWDGAFGKLSEKAPVFVGEFGGGDKDLKFGQRLLEYLDAREIGWAAWSWSDKPPLMSRYVLTRFGGIVTTALGNRST